MEKLYTVNEVAEMLHLTTRTIRNYLASGALKGRKIGAQWRFTQTDIDDFMNGRSLSADALVADSASDELTLSAAASLTGQPSLLDGDTARTLTVLDMKDADGTLCAEISSRVAVMLPTLATDTVPTCECYHNAELGVARFVIRATLDQLPKIIKCIRKG